MSIDFRGVTLKIERAEHHIVEYSDLTQALQNAGLYTIGIKDGPQTGRRTIYVDYVDPMLAERTSQLSAVAGDAVHNLRSALDHLAFGLTPRPSDTTAFPVWRKDRTPTPQELRALIGDKMRGAPKKVADAIHAIEPHRGGAGHYIWLLHYLDIVDKHRLLMTIALSYRSFGFDAAAGIRKLIADSPDFAEKMGREVPRMKINLRPADRLTLEQGAELFSAPVEYLEAQERMDFAFDIAFNEPGILDREPVLPLLRQFVDAVNAVVQTLRQYT